MNVRHFTRASADWIDTSLGNAPVFGPATVLALVKKSSDTTDFEYITQVSQAGDPNNWQFYVGLSGDNKPALWNGAADLASPFTVTAAEGWVLLGCSKATGTVAPRFHKYVLSTGVWTHQDCASSGRTAALRCPPET